MTGPLRIGRGLALPAEAVTQTFAILAKRGVGKTYTASVMTEEMLKAGLPVVAIDPIGVWWGLRAGADGKSEGLPIAVFGGDHGDVPLEKTAGAVIADLVVDERLSAVLDLSQFRKGEQIRFMTDFAERLYHRNREPLHLMLDEADSFAPQRVMRGEGAERLLGAIEDLVRRGRARGLGMTLVTQRPAVLNKNVLTQVEVLVALRTVAPQDRAAIDEWVKHYGETGQREEVMASLSSLEVGESWWWSPGWLDLLMRVKVRRRETFDSSATPKAGQKRTEPRKLADVDLEQVRDKIAATIERAAADDPKALRARVRELEGQLAAAKDATPAPEVRTVEKPILLEGEADLLEGLVGELRAVADTARHAADNVAGELSACTDLVLDDRAAAPIVPAARAALDRGREPSRPPSCATDGEGELSKGATGLLETMARRHPMRVTRPQLATLSGRSIKSSSFTAQVSELKRETLIDERDGLLELSEAGAAVGGADSSGPLTAEEVLAGWRRALPSGPRRMLDALIAQPGMGRDELAAAAGFSPTSSSVGAHLKLLRDNGLVDRDGAGLYPSELVAR